MVIDYLASMFGARGSIPFSRGSVGLYSLLIAIRKRYGVGEVIMPSLCCESLALAIVYAGHKPVFAESDQKSLCVTPKTIAPLIGSKTRVVVVVHIFGKDASVDSFDRLRKENPKIFFIEDVAHAIGGYDRDGRLLGGRLDYALLSFADDKIIRGGGGALLYQSQEFTPDELLEGIAGEVKYKASPRYALSLRNTVHGLADLKREQPSASINMAFVEIIPAFRELIVSTGTVSDFDILAKDIERLDCIRIDRMNKYLFYYDNINRNSVELLELHENSMCWRASLMLKTTQIASLVTNQLRSHGVNASNHYFPLNLLFSKESRPITEDISSRIVNLWVDDKTTHEALCKTVEIINEYSI